MNNLETLAYKQLKGMRTSIVAAFVNAIILLLAGLFFVFLEAEEIAGICLGISVLLFLASGVFYLDFRSKAVEVAEKFK